MGFLYSVLICVFIGGFAAYICGKFNKRLRQECELRKLTVQNQIRERERYPDSIFASGLDYEVAVRVIEVRKNVGALLGIDHERIPPDDVFFQLLDCSFAPGRIQPFVDDLLFYFQQSFSARCWGIVVHELGWKRETEDHVLQNLLSCPIKQLFVAFVTAEIQ